MKASPFTRTLLLAGALLFSILACNGQNNAADQVVGTWTKSLNEGSVTFTISAENTWEVEFTGDEEAEVYGSYEIAGKQITFTDEGGDYSSDSSGVYEFKLSAGSLSFTKVDDPVEGRSMLVVGAWSKSSDSGQ